MSKMGENLMEAMQELLEYSEGKIELKATRLSANPAREAIGADEIREMRKDLE